MKKVLCLLSVSIISASLVSAQPPAPAEDNVSSERRALEDSVAMCMFPRNLMDAVLSANMESHNLELEPQEMLKIEYATYMRMSDVIRKMSASMSDKDLRTFYELLDTKAYRTILSPEFLTMAQEYLTKAVMYEAGELRDFSYEVKDKEFAELMATSDINGIDDKVENLKKSLNDMFAGQNMSAEQLDMVKVVVNRVLAHLQDIVALSAMEYLTVEDMWAIEAAAGSDALSGMPESPDYDAETLMAEKLSEMEKDRYINEKLAAYVTKTRSVPYFIPQKVRPYKELKIKKYTYAGETFNTLPHGKGVLTDNKGVRYSGDFRNGKRHGLIEVTKPGEEPVLQVWADGKYRKDIPVGAGVDGKVPDVALFLGNAFGYGSMYDHETSTITEGFFIDGLLNGKGKISTPDYELTSEFIDGQPRNGVIVWKSSDCRSNVFRGLFNGHTREGVHKTENLDGTVTVARGMEVNGNLDGKVTLKVINAGDTVTFKGLFAYGEMWGDGTCEISSAPDKNGIRFSCTYDGSFAASYFHGKGKLCGTNIIPASNLIWTLTRYGVKIDDCVGGSDVAIEMDGRFDGGVFVEGKVTVSNGVVMEGKFKDGILKQGRIVKVYPDGSRYEGECVDGQFEGQGTLEYADGSIFEGTFEEGRPSVGELRNSDGKVLKRYGKTAVIVRR